MDVPCSIQGNIHAFSLIINVSRIQGTYQICPFFFDVQSDENPFFEVFKVPKTKGISFDKSDEIIGHF